MKYDKFAMAQMNRSMVFDLIRRKGPISRAEIARTIGLSIPTVMKITEEFSHKQFVQDVGKGESSGGETPGITGTDTRLKIYYRSGGRAQQNKCADDEPCR